MFICNFFGAACLVIDDCGT